MPLFVALFSFLSSVVGPLVAKVLISLGVGAVTYAGINLLIGQVKTYAISQFGAVGSDVAAIMGLAKFDVAVNIIFAAVVAKAVISGMDKASGSITKIGSVGKGS
ncbi:DUF2523 domain-containing protein [Pseudomonas aeruginosa]|uniref:DUF2523 domain-containing protein n=1 Tax=Pseudomonas aeruginosa TaxID=287 RepID=UPI001C8D6490|nr:DUF2523 domain-containing protein [Pseudomonas aeruginosa]MBX9505111.1 DUF2523 domain-containing protein [Pseudomonas aeruginosa]